MWLHEQIPIMKINIYMKVTGLHVQIMIIHSRLNSQDNWGGGGGGGSYITIKMSSRMFTLILNEIFV